MNIGYLTTLYHTSFILKNTPPEYLKNKLKWSLFATGPAMMEAFTRGDIDIGYIGLPPIMIGIEKGLNIKCVAGGHVEGTVMIGSYSYETFNELGNIKSVLSQFEGENIGTPTRGCIHDIIIRKLTQKFDINIKNYSWADFIPEAIKEGEIAAGVGTPSLATSTSQQYNHQIIIPPYALWPYNPSYGIVAKEELIEEEPDFLFNFLKAHEDACNLIRNHRNKAAIITEKEIEVVNRKFITDTYHISPRYCASLPEAYIDSTLKFIPVLKDLGYMEESLNKKDIFETDLIKKVHPEPAHY